MQLPLMMASLIRWALRSLHIPTGISNKAQKTPRRPSGTVSRACGVWTERVKLPVEAPGGREAGLMEAVAPVGIPFTARSIGLDNAVPCVVTLNWKLAAVPAATVCVAGPELANMKSAADAPTVTTTTIEELGRKFASPEYAAIRL
jgi:hypothetical protein